MDDFRRFAGAAILWLIALGFQLFGFESTLIAVVLWVVAVIGAIAALLTWEPVARHVPLLARLRGPDLRATILKEEWDNYQHLALILELQLRLENRSSKRKQISSYDFNLHSGGYVADQGQQLALRQEVEARKRRHPQLPSVLDARSKASGWLVYHLPWSGGARPDYTLTVLDELSIQYQAKHPG